MSTQMQLAREGKITDAMKLVAANKIFWRSTNMSTQMQLARDPL